MLVHMCSWKCIYACVHVGSYTDGWWCMRRPKVNSMSILWSVSTLFFEANSMNWTQSSLTWLIELVTWLFVLTIYFSAFWALKLQVVAMPTLHFHRFWGTLVLTFIQQIHLSTQPSPQTSYFIFTFVSKWCDVFSIWATKTIVFHCGCCWKLILDNRYLKQIKFLFFWKKGTLYTLISFNCCILCN